MAARTLLGFSLALGLVACGGRSASDGGETGGPEQDDPCVTVLDPEIYQSPAWTPAPLLETEECPRVDGVLELALPAPVLVTGTVQLDGVPSQVPLHLTRRSDQGTVLPEVGADGSFEALVLPGRYDVRVGMPEGIPGHFTLVLEDIDLSAPTELVVDGPGPITISGTLTMDGQPPPDPFGYILIRPAAINIPEQEIVHMELQTYAVTVGPGAYNFMYTWCDYSNPPPVHSGLSCISQGNLPDIPADAPRIGPVQFEIPLLDGMVFTEDTTLDIDIPTAMVSGTVVVDGAPPSSDEEVLLRHGGKVGPVDPSFNTEAAFGGDPDQDGHWGGRVIAGTYDLHFGWLSGPVHESLLIDHDMTADLALDTVLISGIFPTKSPITSYGEDEYFISSGLHVHPLDDIGAVHIEMLRDPSCG